MTTKTQNRLPDSAQAASARVRRECAEYKRRVGDGSIPIGVAIRDCTLPIRVHHLLTAQKGWGPTKAAVALKRANLASPDIRMGHSSARNHSYRIITPAERARLIAAIDRQHVVEQPQFLDDMQKAVLRDRMVEAGCSMDQVWAVVK